MPKALALREEAVYHPWNRGHKNLPVSGGGTIVLHERRFLDSRSLSMKSFKYALITCAWAVALTVAARAGELPQAAPDEVGIVGAKLERTKAVIKDMIDKKQ